VALSVAIYFYRPITLPYRCTVQSAFVPSFRSVNYTVPPNLTQQEVTDRRQTPLSPYQCNLTSVSKTFALWIFDWFPVPIRSDVKSN